jgi:hypothetical protein
MRRFALALLLLAGAPAMAAGPATPPTARQIIRALLANGDVPLTVHSSCKGVGADPGDVNLRDYVSGLLANFTEADAKNSISTGANAITMPGGEKRWECRVEFVHVPQGDPFRYGVTFQMRMNGSLVRHSVRCTGSG